MVTQPRPWAASSKGWQPSGEGTFSDIQSKRPLSQSEVVSSCFTPCYLVRKDRHPPCYLLKTAQSSISARSAPSLQAECKLSCGKIYTAQNTLLYTTLIGGFAPFLPMVIHWQFFCHINLDVYLSILLYRTNRTLFYYQPSLVSSIFFQFPDPIVLIPVDRKGLFFQRDKGIAANNLLFPITKANYIVWLKRASESSWKHEKRYTFELQLLLMT